MTEDPPERRNDRHRTPWPAAPSPWLLELEDLLPRQGRALDVAGGIGRNARWLAARGLDVTLVDTSERALEMARQADEAAGLSIELVRADLGRGELPPGPWNLIVCIHYLQRDLFPVMARELAPGGLLVLSISTVRNTELHPRPSTQYLLGPGEAPDLVPDLDIVSYDEGRFDGHFEARVVARRGVSG